MAKDVLELPEFSDTVEKYREQQEEAAKPKGFLKAGWEKLK